MSASWERGTGPRDGGREMAHVMPLSAGDIGVKERFSTFTHRSGIQGEGNDFLGHRWTSDTDWPQLLSDAADPDVLKNWVIYNKPFYAMASGTVVGGWRNAPENTPGSLHPDFKAGRFAGGGNHLWILQDDGVYALYAHATPGSIPAALCPHDAKLFPGKSSRVPDPDIDEAVRIKNGAKVKAGQFLGRIGNTGASEGGPHLHVHMERAGKPVVMKFARGMTTPFKWAPLPPKTPWSKLTGAAEINGPWTKLSGKALPKGTILVWPPRPIGNYTFKGTPAAEYQSLFDHMSDSGMMPEIITCKGNGATYDTNWIPSKGTWVCFFGMTAAEAASKHASLTAQGFKRTSSFTCGSETVAVWRK